jgi:hypothetical protein
VNLLRPIAVLLLGVSLLGLSCRRSPVIAVQEGDIVFQTSQSAQSQAIQAATHSPTATWADPVRNGAPYVLEARAWTRLTPYREWIHRGEGGRYVVKRLRDSTPLHDPARLEALRRAALAFLRRPCDDYFSGRMSALLLRAGLEAYDRGIGVQLGALAPLIRFDLSSPVVKTS